MSNQIRLKAQFEQVVVKANTPTKLVLVLVSLDKRSSENRVYTEDYANCLKALENEDLNITLQAMQGGLFNESSDYDRGYDDGFNAACDRFPVKLDREHREVMQEESKLLADMDATQNTKSTVVIGEQTIDTSTGEVLESKTETLPEPEEEIDINGDAPPPPVYRDCPVCHGSGMNIVTPDEICGCCHGSGVVEGYNPPVNEDSNPDPTTEPPDEAETVESQPEATETAEEEPGRYKQEDGTILFVSDGISNGDLWGTFYRKANGSLKRVTSASLPMVSSRDQAQTDLDKWATRKKLPKVEPTTTDNLQDSVTVGMHVKHSRGEVIYVVESVDTSDVILGYRDEPFRAPLTVTRWDLQRYEGVEIQGDMGQC